MNDKTILIFFILLGISFFNSILFSDAHVMMNWIYALAPLLIALMVLFITEMSARKSIYYG